MVGRGHLRLAVHADEVLVRCRMHSNVTNGVRDIAAQEIHVRRNSVLRDHTQLEVGRRHRE